MGKRCRTKNSASDHVGESRRDIFHYFFSMCELENNNLLLSSEHQLL